MMQTYVTLSLETHLFFGRIMKEHALFLAAGFPCKEESWIEDTEYFREQFECLLTEVLKISNGRINNHILTSEELVTEFTLDAENKTECLSGVSINQDITRMQKALCAEPTKEDSREIQQTVHHINERSIWLLNELINFKERILREVSQGNLFTFNYPLLIQHIIREAKLYRATIDSLMRNRRLTYRDLWGTEEFWNQIMMEHAWFIRGLLDPCEEELIKTANDFAMDYRKLLEKACRQNCAATGEPANESLAETLKYRDFKAAGTKGILNCEIDSVILPLLADHVLREANHYIRILECSK